MPAYQVERPEEVEPQWLQGCQKIGVTAGASTPDWVVEEVVGRLRELAAVADGLPSHS